MALRIYQSPTGQLFQYEEGEQPEGFALAASQPAGAEKPKAAPRKRRTTANKARTAEDK